MLSNDVLRETIQEAAKAVRSREEDVNVARIHLAEAERELNLLVELAEIREIPLPDEARPSGSPPRGSVTNGAASQQAQRRVPSRGKTSLLPAVVEILREHGEPMQIRDLMAAVKERSVPIPGKGQQANLIAHISRDQQIVRPRRGFYALREWGLEDGKSPSRPKRRRTRRRPSASA